MPDDLAQECFFFRSELGYAGVMTAVRLVLLLGMLAGCGHGALPPSAPNDKLGQVVSFSLPSNDGTLVTVPVQGAHATVLDFFGPTCEPCKKALPELYAQRHTLEARNSKLILVAVLADGESSDDAKRALQAWGVDAPFLVDSHETGRREAGVTALPATMVLDAQGVTKWVAPAAAAVEDVIAAAE